ncbi:MAG: pantetheine-phosphate adenylyltransferase [Stappiaceae bacterium]
MTGIALYPGSFDPITNGHIDVMRQTLGIVDRVVVAIGTHAGKSAMFDFDQRLEMINNVSQTTFGTCDADRISVISFDGLVIDAARKLNASILVRGLRDGTDLDYEMQMAGMNGAMAPDIQTIFVPATPGTRHITATLVRQIAKMGGDVAAFVPEEVAKRLNSVRSS